MKLAPNKPRKMSRHRVIIEAALVKLDKGATATSAELAQLASISKDKCGELMHRLATHDLAQNLSKNAYKANWAATEILRRRHRQENAPRPDPSQRNTPICPSTQPNGSVEYWENYQAWVMTPARTSLQAKAEVATS